MLRSKHAYNNYELKFNFTFIDENSSRLPFALHSSDDNQGAYSSNAWPASGIYINGASQPNLPASGDGYSDANVGWDAFSMGLSSSQYISND